jgi:hypothetical protein
MKTAHRMPPFPDIECYFVLMVASLVLPKPPGERTLYFRYFDFSVFFFLPANASISMHSPASMHLIPFSFSDGDW